MRLDKAVIGASFKGLRSCAGGARTPHDDGVAEGSCEERGNTIADLGCASFPKREADAEVVARQWVKSGK